MKTILSKSLFIKIARSKFTYVGLYFFMIPLFAGIYTLTMPQDFLHTNIHLEKGFRVDKKKSLEEIKKSLNDFLKTATFDKHPQYSVSHVKDISYKDKRFLFSIVLVEKKEIHRKRAESNKCEEILIQAKNEENEIKKKTLYLQHKSCNLYSYISTQLPCEARADLNLDLEVMGEESFNVEFFSLLYEIGSDYFQIGSYLLTCSDDGDSFQKMRYGQIVIGEDGFSTIDQITLMNDYNYKLLENIGSNTLEIRTEKLFKQHELLVNGRQMTASWAMFWRMFYFSAVTITTLGYGDIVPISDRARIFVTIESILGIILIGLFFNALARRY